MNDEDNRYFFRSSSEDFCRQRTLLMAHFCTCESNRVRLGKFVNNAHGPARGLFETYDLVKLTEVKDSKGTETVDFILPIT